MNHHCNQFNESQSLQCAEREGEWGRESADGEIKGWGNGEGKERGRRGRMEESAELEGKLERSR